MLWSAGGTAASGSYYGSRSHDSEKNEASPLAPKLSLWQHVGGHWLCQWTLLELEGKLRPRKVKDIPRLVVELEVEPGVLDSHGIASF